MKITEMNHDSLGILRTEMQSAMHGVAKKHGVDIRIGACSYLDSNATFKVEVATVGSSGIVRSKTRTDFERYASMFGLKKSDLGRKITYTGERFEIVGLKVKSRRFPILAKRLSDGRVYKLPIEVVK